MVKVEELIQDVSRYLSDYDEDVQYVHWTEDDLLSYAQLAVGVLANLDKKHFTKTIDVELVEGSAQPLPDTCAEFNRVQGQKEGGVITRIARRIKLGFFPELNRKPCYACRGQKGDYKLKSYSFDEEDSSTIYVDPPVASGQTGTISITCYSSPTVDSASDVLDIGQDMKPVLFELMLYYAWGVDIEDESTRERSNIHWQNAMTLLKLHIPYKTPRVDQV